MFMSLNIKGVLEEENINLKRILNSYLLNLVFIVMISLLVGLFYYTFSSINSFSYLELFISLAVLNIPVTYFLLQRTKVTSNLKNKQNYYHDLFKENKIITLLIDPKTANIKDANSSALSFYGYTREEITNKKITEINQLSETEVKEEMKQAKEEDRNYFQFIHQLADSSLREVEVYSNPIVVNGEELLYSFIYDITEKKRLKKAVKNQKIKYKTLFETTGTATFFVEENSIITLVNQQSEVLTGYNKEELETEFNFLDLVADSDQKNKMLTYHQYRKEKKEDVPNRYEFTLQDKHGNFKEVLGTIQMIEETNQSIVSLIDVTERKKYQNEIEYISFHDELTDIYNRSYLEAEIKRLDVERQLPITLIMADLNGLKMINDTYGHAQGDEVLIQTTEILKRACRKEDIVARWGGDEFVILLPKTKKDQAQMIYDRIKRDCEKTKEDEIPISIALGIATKEEVDHDIYDILNIAEERMYKNKLDESRSTKSHIVKALLKTLGEKSNETEEHAWRMQHLAFSMGEKMNLSQARLDKLSLLATLHDIGKTIVPAEILTKPGKLNEEEWEIIKQHPETGYRIASSTEEFAHVAEEILCHHEKWDGSGYPGGLEGENIPLLSRIITIVDAYDVMTNQRSYKEAMSKEAAVEELRNCAGKQFDPKLVKHFIEVIQIMSKSS